MGRHVFAYGLSVMLAAGCILDRGGLIDEGIGGSTATAQGGSTTTTTGGAGPGPTTTQGGGPTTSVGGGGAMPDCDQDGFECVPAAPLGPNGRYVALVANMADCPGDVATLEQCDASQCTCAAATASCAATLGYYTNDNCNGSPFTTIPAGAPCNGNPQGDNNRWAQLTGAPTNDCAPADASPPPSTATACELAAKSDGCAANEVCVPSVPNAEASCVLVDSESCPPAYPESLKTWYDSLDSCDCTCDGSCATPEVLSHQDTDDCSDNPPMVVPLSMQCSPLGQPDSIVFPAFSATCAPELTTTGGVGGRTLCCRPN